MEGGPARKGSPYALEASFVRTAADPYASATSETVVSDAESPTVETGSLEDRPLEAELLARLDAIDAKLEHSEETVALVC